jgi:hypothetical protein
LCFFVVFFFPFFFRFLKCFSHLCFHFVLIV